MAPSFMSLPTEIRLRIYSELLDPPSPRRLLYHDRHGRREEFGIHPTILRTNRQIYGEASSVLYDSKTPYELYLATSVVVQCTGGDYPDGLGSPEPLLKCGDGAKGVAAARDATDPECGYALAMAYSEQGVILPQSIQRMKNIVIYTSRNALWGSAQGGTFKSHIQDILRELLTLFSEDEEPVGRCGRCKSLTVDIGSPRSFEHKPYLGCDDYIGSRGGKFESPYRMLEALQTKRHVKVTGTFGGIEKEIGIDDI